MIILLILGIILVIFAIGIRITIIDESVKEICVIISYVVFITGLTLIIEFINRCI